MGGNPVLIGRLYKKTQDKKDQPYHRRRVRVWWWKKPTAIASIPPRPQENLLRRTIGCARLVYNKALAFRTESWYERQERVGYRETSSMLTNWKKEEELDFLNEVSCVPLQQGLRHLQTAFTNFFGGRAKYPNFKKKHNGGSAEFTCVRFPLEKRTGISG